MHFKDASAVPRTEAWSSLVNDQFKRRLAAGWQRRGWRRSGACGPRMIGTKNMPWFLIGSTWRRMLSMNEGIVSAPVAHARARDQVVHRQQRRDQPGVPGHRRPAAKG